MLLAGLCNNITTVTLGNHYQAGAVILELIYVWVHTVGCGRTHRATWIALWSLGWTSIEDRVVLEVLWHLLASIQASLELGMSDVTSHDDGTLQVYTGAYWILAQLSTNCVDTLVEVNLDTLGTLTWVAELLRNQLCWVLVHLLQPDTVLVDLSLDVAVGRAAYTHTDRAACTVTRQTDYAVVQGIDGLRDAYETGRGKVIISSKYTIDTTKANDPRIVITEIP